MKCKRGIILAGGTGSRLYPLTIAVNKQLMPIYDKPTIYYPLSALMLAELREILIISTPNDIDAMKLLLGNGEQFGLSIEYKIQDEPRGLPEAFIIAKDFIQSEPVAMILGDNFFYGQGFSALLVNCAKNADKAHTFLYSVKNPSLYGVAKFTEDHQNLKDVIEKPTDFISRWAITGLYFFPGDVSERAASLKPSKRGEIEIVDLIRQYIKDENIEAHKLTRGNVWFDVGSPEALLQASHLVEVLQNRQNILIASPEEVAWRLKFIDDSDYKNLIEAIPKSTYRTSLELTLET